MPYLWKLLVLTHLLLRTLSLGSPWAGVCMAGYFQSKGVWPFCGEDKARWCLSLPFLLLVNLDSSSDSCWEQACQSFGHFLLIYGISSGFITVFFISVIITSHLSVNKEKTPEDLKMRRLLGCSIRHLLPLSIKLISLLIIHVFHTLCLLVLCFQDDSLNADFKAIGTEWREHQNICSWVFWGKRWFRHCFRHTEI